MLEVSRFYGIVVRIFCDDHKPPHFHAEYGEHEVLINIDTLAAWERASRLQPPGKIEPLP